MTFKDRRDGGKKLAGKLMKYKDQKDVVVLGLPRGGVVTAAEVAKVLNVPLDIVVPRKIGHPDNPEFAIGALAEEGIPVMNESYLESYGVPQEYIDRTVEVEKKEAERRLKLYRGKRPPLDLKNKIAVLVDDGIATGATMRAAIVSARHKGAKKIVVAVPVTARDSKNRIARESDEFVAVHEPLFFGAVGAFYEEFGQTEDQEVIEIMKERE